MAKYTVFFTSTASTSVEVEAGSRDEAEELSWNEISGSLCHRCAGHVELSGDWDVDTIEER